MSGLFVIVERDKTGVGLARSGLFLVEADRICAQLARAYPLAKYTVERQKMVGRGNNRRVEYPAP